MSKVVELIYMTHSGLHTLHFLGPLVNKNLGPNVSNLSDMIMEQVYAPFKPLQNLLVALCLKAETQLKLNGSGT